jgi:hypothetical protein
MLSNEFDYPGANLKSEGEQVLLASILAMAMDTLRQKLRERDLRADSVLSS